ncbi:FAD:protein FMN transferase [Chakrabartyella piscis]|uniref:FAD:protein FMN transferase n=1 Tax=Chakrabartyella piscis TaxID=2918914 RepID=UPI002958CE9E|nr:FAD:protein FMN transferase [Chakrabartyella piscis]
MNIKKTLLFPLMAALLLAGCSEKREEAQKQLAMQKEENLHEVTTFAMDTVMMFHIYHEDGDAILIEVEQEIRRLEALFSITVSDSEIAQLNANAGIQAVDISPDTNGILTRGLEFASLTDEAYNMNISPIVSAWGFATDEGNRVPSLEELESVLPLTTPDGLVLEEDTAYLQEAGMSVDLGGIAKGYTADLVVDLLHEKGVTNGWVSLGGNLSMLGTKTDGSMWELAVQNPIDASDYVGMISATDQSVVTSGGYQRYFEEDGVIYHHIIDGKTGYPADSGLISVTIVSEDSTKADALSTALFVMGLEESLDLWRMEQDFEAIFVTEDGRVVATEGIADRFVFEGRDNDFVYEVVDK